MVAITEANARAAANAADRLLKDAFLQEALDEMIELGTVTAMRGADAAAREEARQQVLAILRLRENLQAVFENWRSAAQLLQQQRANE
jgi:hypothetical protein